MSADDDIENLTRIPLFAIFETRALRKLAFSSETRLFRAGDALFRKGEESDGGFILAMGSVGLSPRDDGDLPKHIVYPWALIGEIALVAPSRRPVTAHAMEPTTALKIGRPLFHQILEQYPTTAARTRDFFKERLVSFARSASASLAGDR